jgi:hypothetical protein
MIHAADCGDCMKPESTVLANYLAPRNNEKDDAVELEIIQRCSLE